ncbi:hypothetical protein F4805DRAFT_28635 [Annulohypoxylon moriforme]|nr:hypothetical protein F4805DRAFT_28635 [Annulohypoxylon moriforme]
MTPPILVEPETFWVNPTPYVPNSRLPVVVYRGAMKDTSPENIVNVIEPNGWRKGGQWKTFKKVHFHSNVHECYGIIRGRSTYRLGKSDLDADTDENGNPVGVKFFAQAGDVFVLPAGIGHCSIDSEGDYEYVGLYCGDELPHGTPFDIHWCKDTPEKTKELAQASARVPLPALDPLYGGEGPLPTIWKLAAQQDEVHK